MHPLTILQLVQQNKSQSLPSLTFENIIHFCLQMNHNLFLSPFSPPLLNILLLASFLLARKSISAIDSQFLACNPQTCGDQTITFPFFIENQQKDFCGFPGFGVICNNGRPILRLENNNYTIHHISYETHTLRVSNSNTSLLDCVPPFQNTSFSSSDKFKLNDNQTDLVLLYNCNSTRIGLGDSELLKYRVNCSRDSGSDWSLAMFEGDPLLGSASGVCGNAVETAVDVERGGESGGIQRMLERGFLLNWVATNCSLCQRSGGKCGFDFNIFQFQCFCPDRPYFKSCVSGGHQKFVNKVVLGVFGTSLVCGFIVLVIWKRQLFRPQRKNNDFEAFLEKHGPLAIRRYNYSQVKKMTNSFAEKLGQGGYGSVYKGKLLDGHLVAVKMLNVSKEEGKEFLNEVAAISRTSHVNIVTLLGFCLEGRKRALVYEFMPHGSLDKLIFHKTTLILGWESIHRIAIGIAQGLEYLHRGCNTRIVHFDIKPHNILLDENLIPKISDFGLAKLCTRTESIVSMLEARGTIGYIAPEVFCRNFGQVSSKSDIYSYGMVILKIVEARKTDSQQIEGNNSSEMYFPNWIYKSLELENEEENISDEDGDIVRKLKLIGLWCIQTNPSERPTMSNVIEMLQGNQTINIPPKPFLSTSSSSSSQFPLYSSTASSS